MRSPPQSFSRSCAGRGSGSLRFSPQDRLILLIQVAAGTLSYSILLLVGLRFTTAANAAVVVGTLPVVTGLIAIAVFGQPATRRFLLSLAIALCGVVLVTLRFGEDGVVPPTLLGLLGIGIVLLAVACQSVFILLNRKLSQPLPTLTLATTFSVLGLLLSLGPAAFEWWMGWVSWPAPSVLLACVYYAVVPTVIGFLLLYEAQRRVGPGEVALLTSTVPVTALALSGLILGEMIVARQVLGCALVVLAVVVGVRGSGKGGRAVARR